MHSRANTPFAGGRSAWRSASTRPTSTAMHVIAHGGDTDAFHSDLHLFLDKNVGIFVSFNSAGQGGRRRAAAQRAVRGFRRPLLPGSAERASTKADPNGAKADAEKLAGVYSTTRGSRSNFLAVARPPRPGQGRRRQGRQPAHRRMPRGLNGQPRKWVAHRPDDVARRRRP